jgi:hypothetical protein
MEIDVDPGVASLFGGRTRALTLGALANSGQPLTAYRIAQITGTQVIKAVTELRKLERGGFVARVDSTPGPVRWVMLEDSLRNLLRRRVRVVWSADWNRTIDERVRGRNRSSGTNIDLSRFTPNPQGVPNPSEFTRSAEKDRILARAGLRVSRRGGNRR